MKTQILKKRIFLSNALMILLTLAAVVLVNLAAVKIQREFIERDWSPAWRRKPCRYICRQSIWANIFVTM